MKQTFSRSSLMIGLDIQPHGIYLLQLRKSQESFTVQKAAIINLPHKCTNDNKVKYWETLTHMLKNTVQELKLNKHQAAVCLSFNSVKFQHLQLNKDFSEEELESEIHAKMMRDLPGLNNDIYVDYSELPYFKKNQTEILLAVIRQDYLNQSVNCVQSAGLRVKVVDVDIYAIQRAYCHQPNLAWQQEDAHALIHSVNNKMILIVFNQHEIIFYQQWQLDLANGFLEQIEKNLKLCEASFPNWKISSVICLASNHELLKYHNQLSYPLRQVNPFDKITFHSDVDKELVRNHVDKFIIACGLAMREVPTW